MDIKEKRKKLNAEIGIRIRQCRESAGYTQEKLADLIDVTIQYISDLERGKVGASLLTIVNLCHALSVSADYLLLGRRESNDVSDLVYRLETLSPNQMQVVEDGVNVLLTALTTNEPDKH